MKNKNLYYTIPFMMLTFLMLLGGCKESEIHYSHARHMERGLKDCNTCHNYKEDLEPKWPKMAKCLSCHMKDFDTSNPKSCLLCHTRPGMKIKVKHNIPKKYRDLKFTHKAHLENKVECVQCHKGIEKSDAITLDLIPDMFGTCIPCHKERGEEGIACNVCHKHIKKNRM
ncbi:MAG TPA: cytochrome c3 family protein, partial [Candidatus Wunengus sp. YC64]|uniref:cytochrome c3 family protein n=3 Tax=unclassified Candidatus Wunengus TaxID=3367695 RepID=UPI0040297E7A